VRGERGRDGTAYCDELGGCPHRHSGWFSHHHLGVVVVVTVILLLFVVVIYEAGERGGMIGLGEIFVVCVHVCVYVCMFPMCTRGIGSLITALPVSLTSKPCLRTLPRSVFSHCSVVPTLIFTCV
jgi:cytochrome b561